MIWKIRLKRAYQYCAYASALAGLGAATVPEDAPPGGGGGASPGGGGGASPGGGGGGAPPGGGGA